MQVECDNAGLDDVERGRPNARVADDSQTKKPRTVLIDARTRSLSPSMRVDRAATAPAPVCLETVNAEELAEMKATLGGTPKNPQTNTPPDVPTPFTVANYFRKWKGVPHMKRVDVGLILIPHWTELAVALVGAFCGIGVLSALQYLALTESDVAMLIGSFGATAVLLYGAPSSPLAQPRNVVGGHIVSAIAGVGTRQLLGDVICGRSGYDCTWLASALAVAIAIIFMLITQCVHPPGGATALIACIGSQTLQDENWLYVIIPVGCGASVMVLVCLIVNNFDPYRSYPQYWW